MLLRQGLRSHERTQTDGRIGRVEGTREMVVWANYIIVYQEDAFSVRILRILRILHAAQQWPSF